ncbi:MAG: hypothetical protein IKL96_05390, partial [Kiritimatiellae bacterium]|nr:hypothetical protein [Kiritimatiellia bacterium]
MTKKLMAMFAAAMAAGAAAAGLVAKWDFDAYDPANPESAAILAPTVGGLAAIPCTGTASSTEVTDGTLGPISVVSAGLPEGDWALAIPTGAHLKIPLPAGIVRDKSWMLRIRFLSPAASAGKLRALVSANMDNGGGLWFIAGNNIIQGAENLFGTSFEENQNTVGNGGAQKSNGMKEFRLVSSDVWHSFTAHFGPDATSSTLNGYRCVSLLNKTDVRTQFTGDGFLLGAGGTADWPLSIASVEVWEDAPIYRDASGGAYLPSSSRTVFAGCTLEDLRDMYISVKGLGSWGLYARTMSSWEHIVTTDGDGNVTDLKIDLRGRSGGDAILCDFAPGGGDVAGNTLRMQWSLAWPNQYFTAEGAFTSSANYQTAPTSYNGGGYAAYNIYALPFRPLDGSLAWSMQMGSGKFGNPVFSIIGANPVLTFDVAPQADSLTLDCGRGDGRAAATFAYAMPELKNMAKLGALQVGDGVALTMPAGVVIPGAVTFGRGASIAFEQDGPAIFENGQTFLMATDGIVFPEGVAVGAVASASRGTVEFADDNTRLVYKAPPANEPITAVWTGGGQRATVNDPLNWTCWNYRDEVLEGAVPSVFTTITVTGATTFNVPAGQTLTCKQLTIGSCSLEADCDWSGIGAHPPFVDNTEVDMNGHNLTVGGLNSNSTVTIKNEVEGDPSEFCVFATEDTVNTKVLISGNVKFVKDGAAKYTSAKGQTYTGGNELLGGVASASLNATQQTTFGVSGSRILVRNATLELGGQVWFTVYKIVLDGGTISSAFSEGLGRYTGGAIFGNTRLLSDSSLQTVGNGNLRLWSGHLLDLGEHTLSVNLADSTIMLLGSDVDAATSVTSISNGTFAVTGGTFRPLNYKGTVEARTANMRMNCAMNINDACTLNVGGYEALYEGDDNAGVGAMNVYGRFKPVADGFYGCRLQNGAVLDLNARRG